MKLFSYIVARDYGFAPNPFYGYCTLATCKPKIRQTCQVEDWVIGTGSQEEHRPGQLVFAMRVSEIMCFDDYWADPRFRLKRANLQGSLKQAYGDNIYHRPSRNCAWQQLPSHHSLHDGQPNPANVEPDTGVNRVLISDHFAYWGCMAPTIPQGHRKPTDVCCERQGHKCIFPHAFVMSFLQWVETEVESWGFQGGQPYRWINR